MTMRSFIFLMIAAAAAWPAFAQFPDKSGYSLTKPTSREALRTRMVDRTSVNPKAAYSRMAGSSHPASRQLRTYRIAVEFSRSRRSFRSKAKGALSIPSGKFTDPRSLIVKVRKARGHPNERAVTPSEIDKLYCGKLAAGTFLLPRHPIGRRRSVSDHSAEARLPIL